MPIDGIDLLISLVALFILVILVVLRTCILADGQHDYYLLYIGPC